MIAISRPEPRHEPNTPTTPRARPEPFRRHPSRRLPAVPGVPGPHQVWMRTRRQHSRTVFILRDRLTGVPMRCPAQLLYPDGRSGRIRLFGFHDTTLAVPLDNRWRTSAPTAPPDLPPDVPPEARTGNEQIGGHVGRHAAGHWWPAIITTTVPLHQATRIPMDLATALEQAGVGLEVFAMPAQRRHAVAWVRSAEPGDLRQARVAAVVGAALRYGDAAGLFTRSVSTAPSPAPLHRALALEPADTAEPGDESSDSDGIADESADESVDVSGSGPEEAR